MKKDNKEEKTNEFELNTKILQNFDKIMSMKLDEVETLRITELDNGSKLLNIMSLCANLKNLIIDGNLRINTDKVIKNIFKADKLEKLVLINVKLPKNNTLKKCVNLKEISLDSIRGFDIKDFIENGIVNKGGLKSLKISNSEMLYNSINFLSKCYNLKNLELNNLRNCKFEDLNFLKRLRKLERLSLLNNEIPIKEVNNILEFEGQRDVDVAIIGDGQVAKLKIDKKNISEIDTQSKNISYIYKKMNLFKVDKLSIFIDKGIDDFDIIKKLIACKKKIKIIIKDYSSLNLEQAEKIKECLGIKNLINNENKKISIDQYLSDKKLICKIVKIVNYSDTEIQKFLKIYKTLGQKIELSENKKSETKMNCEKTEVANFLQKCLQCVNIESTIIYGDDLENGEPHYWNQVKIDDKWYNVDLALDIPKIKKKRVDYCLIDDEDFYEYHTAKSGQKHYCKDEYNYKFINVFIKTGLFKEQLLASYIEIMKAKFRKIFGSNNQEKILALPSGDNIDSKISK